MKVEHKDLPPQPKPFSPIVITIETEGEAAILARLIGPTSGDERARRAEAAYPVRLNGSEGPAFDQLYRDLADAAQGH